MALVTNIIFANILNKICQVFIVSSLLVTASYGENIFDPDNCTCETSTISINASIYGDPIHKLTKIQCPVYNQCCKNMLESFNFWLEGVVQVLIANLGIVINTAFCFILGSKEMRNSFNSLLISLAVFDNGYLFASILESFRKCFKLASTVHIYLFPYLLYPFTKVMMSASIFMTVAIAMERYIAVQYPVDLHLEMSNLDNAHTIRFLKYLVPVFTFSVTFNVPKFLEATLLYDNRTGDPNQPFLTVTELRLSPEYSIVYNNWIRLVITGIVPFILLVFFNAKIYTIIRERQKEQTQNLIDDGNKNEDARSSRQSFIMRSNSSAAESKRAAEDKLSIIFLGIVILFLICHVPRIFLALQEAYTARNSMACRNAVLSTVQSIVSLVANIEQKH